MSCAPGGERETEIERETERDREWVSQREREGGGETERERGRERGEERDLLSQQLPALDGPDVVLLLDDQHNEGRPDKQSGAQPRRDHPVEQHLPPRTIAVYVMYSAT